MPEECERKIREYIHNIMWNRVMKELREWHDDQYWQMLNGGWE